ncbi:hypothetical protein HYQ46_005876 [Verticillium longisporum]|nr:hypothetical protein HYQ46_005876 [Verticillium longisporum]
MVSRLLVGTTHGSQREGVGVVCKVEVVPSARLLHRHDPNRSHRVAIPDTWVSHEIIGDEGLHNEVLIVFLNIPAVHTATRATVNPLSAPLRCHGGRHVLTCAAGDGCNGDAFWIAWITGNNGSANAHQSGWTKPPAVLHADTT